MLQVTLGEKTYTVPYVSAIALREIARPMAILNRDEKEKSAADAGADLDVLVNWFCLMFGDQFTPDDVYRHYPADRLITDIALSVLAVQQRVSGALTAFPTRPAAEEAKTVLGHGHLRMDPRVRMAGCTPPGSAPPAGNAEARVHRRNYVNKPTHQEETPWPTSATCSSA